MPAVSYLFGVRRALLPTFGVITPAIAAYDLHTWVLSQPLGEGFGFAIWQKVYWHALFEIDEDRAEGNPSPKREIIHAQHARRRVRGLRGRMDVPKERVRPGAEAHPCYQALSCFPAECKADERENIGQT